ncbi:hypothetical protein CF327_g5546 [Tilletia walkeri]|nr:hypothetical protein CF327_g5546 [Tilletia walkeri]
MISERLQLRRALGQVDINVGPTQDQADTGSVDPPNKRRKLAATQTRSTRSGRHDAENHSSRLSRMSPVPISTLPRPHAPATPAKLASFDRSSGNSYSGATPSKSEIVASSSSNCGPRLGSSGKKSTTPSQSRFTSASTSTPISTPPPTPSSLSTPARLGKEVQSSSTSIALRRGAVDASLPNPRMLRSSDVPEQMQLPVATPQTPQASSVGLSLARTAPQLPSSPCRFQTENVRTIPETPANPSNKLASSRKKSQSSSAIRSAPKPTLLPISKVAVTPSSNVNPNVLNHKKNTSEQALDAGKDCTRAQASNETPQPGRGHMLGVAQTPRTPASPSLATLLGQRLSPRSAAAQILNREQLLEAVRQARQDPSFTLKDFQLEVTYRVLAGWDGIMLSETGSGKSFSWIGSCLAAPRATFLVLGPLKELQISQVRALHKLGIKAVALNEDTLRRRKTFLDKIKGDSKRGHKDALDMVAKGNVQIIFASPEILLRNQRVIRTLYTSKWARALTGIFVDEAHVVHDWGILPRRKGSQTPPFRPEYGKIRLIRARFGSSIPLVAVTATLTADILKDVFESLEFGRLPFFALDVGMERESTSYEVECMNHPARSYADLVELFAADPSTPADIPQTIIYVNTRKEAADAASAIRRALPDHLALAVTSITSMSSAVHKHKVLQDDFPNGHIRIMVATEAVGMGVDLPVVDVVVQWRLPNSLKAVVQHFGRGARREGQTSRAILFMDKKLLSSLKVTAPIFKPPNTQPPAVEAPRSSSRGKSSPASGHIDLALRKWLITKTCRRQLLRSMLRLDFTSLRLMLNTNNVEDSREPIGLGPIPSSQDLSNTGSLPTFFWQRSSTDSTATSISINKLCCSPCGSQFPPLRRQTVAQSESQKAAR